MDITQLNEADHELIQREANSLASGCSLSKKRVQAVFYRLLEADWLVPRFPFRTTLDAAILQLNPKLALDIFERENLHDLKRRTMAFEYLSDDYTPLYTLHRLVRLTEAFIEHLTDNEDALIHTGHPTTSFASSPFFDWHLLRLYYVKAPVTIKDGKSLLNLLLANSAKQVGIRNQSDNIIFSYTWAKESPATNPLPGSSFIGNSFITDEGEPITECQYEKAGYILDLLPHYPRYLEGMRKKLYEARLAVLKLLLSALCLRRFNNIWEDSLGILTKTLSYEDVTSLLAVDRVILELEGPRWLGQYSYIPYHNAGLSDLLDIIGHYEVELAIGAMEKTATAFSAIPADASTANYYAILSGPHRGAVDNALDQFIELEQTRSERLTEYRLRVNAAIRSEFTENHTLHIRTTSRQFEQISPMIRSLVEFAEKHLDVTGILPIFTISAPANADPILNRFQHKGAMWEITYLGESTHVPDIKGVRYLSYLLTNAGKEFTPLELIYAVDGVPDSVFRTFAVDHTPGSESRILADNKKIIPDRLAQRLNEENVTYDQAVDKGYLKTLNTEIEKLEANIKTEKRRKNQQTVAELEKQLAKLKHLLSSSVDIHRKPRPIEAKAERARKMVQKNIARVMDYIKDKHPRLHQHLHNALKGGKRYSYQPESSIRWET